MQPQSGRQRIQVYLLKAFIKANYAFFTRDTRSKYLKLPCWGAGFGSTTEHMPSICKEPLGTIPSTNPSPPPLNPPRSVQSSWCKTKTLNAISMITLSGGAQNRVRALQKFNQLVWCCAHSVFMYEWMNECTLTLEAVLRAN